MNAEELKNAEALRRSPVHVRSFWVISTPIDYPGKYVVRRWHGGPEGLQVTPELFCDVVPMLADDLYEARKLIPPGHSAPRTRIGRDEIEGVNEDPAIVETWV